MTEVAVAEKASSDLTRRSPAYAGIALMALLFVSLVLRVLWLNEPDTALIFDEIYYVNAARRILGWQTPEGSPYANMPAGRDPNREHPPLGKMTIAASMGLFGNTVLGWRLPSLLAGVASIALIFGVVRAAGGKPWVALLAASVFAFDNLAYVHSRIATLDMMLVAFLLLGVWCYLRNWPLVAGVVCGLAALIKLSGIYGVLALVLFAAAKAFLDWRRSGTLPKQSLASAGVLVTAFAVSWLAGLWLIDLRFSAFQTPWEHLDFMLKHGFALARSSGAVNSESYPWQWVINEVQIPYLRIDERTLADGEVVNTRAAIFFRGALNPVVIAAAWPAAGYAGWRAWRLRDPLAIWVVAWIAGTYLAYIPVAVFAHRISYIHYFLPTLPAVAVAIAQMFLQSQLPRPALWLYIIGVLVGFVGYFPFRTIP